MAILERVCQLFDDKIASNGLILGILFERTVLTSGNSALRAAGISLLLAGAILKVREGVAAVNVDDDSEVLLFCSESNDTYDVP